VVLRGSPPPSAAGSHRVQAHTWQGGGFAAGGGAEQHGWYGAEQAEAA
jgi:hypothetical protein